MSTPSPPPSRSRRIPSQRWHIADADPERAARLAAAADLSPVLGQVLLNRDIDTPDQARVFLNPELMQLASPMDEFPDLAEAVSILQTAIARQQRIAICGDYDADGMTSTALLLRALRSLGGRVQSEIPSRMTEGYGINHRIVEDFHAQGVQVILTVDNGIAAAGPIGFARDLGMHVIVTDHHDIPPELPPAHAILNPKLIAESSPYRGLAGVGVAYILAISLAQALGQTQDLTGPLLELFTLGTIADLAPLTGVNRRWLQRGLRRLPKSQLAGVQALIQVAGVNPEQDALKPEAIGFRLGPRINAVGRIADPNIVIDLLTTDDPGVALERAMQCEEVNQLRQRLCELIEQEAIALAETYAPNLQNDRVLLLVKDGWHHGVIGIVASRLVERYGVPVFIGTYEEGDPTRIRGSARGIPEFNVFDALQCCADILDKFGGHRAAGGFSLATENLEEMRSRLRIFANMHLQPQHLRPLIEVDAQANLHDLTLDLYQQIDQLHPCGIGNPDPVFWTPNVRIVEQQVIGKDRSHLRVVVAQDDDEYGIKAIAWRWGEYCPLPSPIDIAYRLRLNEWNGQMNVELELIGIRLPGGVPIPDLPDPPPDPPEPASDSSPQSSPSPVSLPGLPFPFNNRTYTCHITTIEGQRELHIYNPDGQLLATRPRETWGFLGKSRAEAQPVDVSQPHYFNLIRAALNALEIAEKTDLLKKKDRLLAEKDQHISALTQQLAHLQQQLDCLSAEQPQTPRSQTQAEPDHAENQPRRPATIPQPQAQINTMQDAVSAEFALESALPNQQAGSASPTPSAPVFHKPAFPKPAFPKNIKAHIGKKVWYCLNPQSQQDLQTAQRLMGESGGETDAAAADYAAADYAAADYAAADYAAVGRSLCAVVLREVVEPFITALGEYWLEQTGDTQLGDLSLDPEEFKTPNALHILAMLLAPTWQAIRESALKMPLEPAAADLYVLAGNPDDEAAADARYQVTEFLQTWEHPVAGWMQRDSTAAASLLAQVGQLSLGAFGKGRSLYPWQLNGLQQKILGKSAKSGLLQSIYGGS
ncbi:single-stranded-DNA-specific exonuclease RecJ [Thermoleptolyngbya sichuanensis XZ-Cy5]|uniref:single-stranded-DNA-specific exonuclease RecJ n=1 Tax=Thermoleptolyngbya sichuanensis TaxID=2885951 RepID=UPI00240D4F13|nr:single-stranded-DNA-specific exonuclease RecJ [Thermoleptolyngbya sichuanensis XZ-Cy5]